LGFSCTEAIFKENQQQRSWWQEQCTEETNVELCECPSLPAEEFIQLISFFKIL
jgi:hypothetical protein